MNGPEPPYDPRASVARAVQATRGVLAHIGDCCNGCRLDLYEILRELESLRKAVK